MIVTCASCNARFMVMLSEIGGTGRNVRCGLCSHQWFQNPETTGAETATLSSLSVISPQEAPNPPFRAITPEPSFTPSAKTIGKGSIRLTHAFSAFLLILLCGQLITAYKSGAMRYMPIMGNLPTANKALDLESLKLSGIEVLKGEELSYQIIGNVYNASDNPVGFPLLRITATGAGGNTLKSWDLANDELELQPGEAVPFDKTVSTRLGEVAKLRVEIGSPLELSLRSAP